MKRFSEQNHYEILEVPYHAAWNEIQRAYELAKKTYEKEAIASYPLFDFQDREQLMKKVEEAYRILSDKEKRRQYDETLVKDVKEIAKQMSISAPTPEAPLPPPSDEVPLSGEINGSTLKGIRERKGISIQEIADRTRINLTYLISIEEDNFRLLPAEVYLRSYLRQYAQALRCDADRFIEGYLKGYFRWRKEKGKEN